MVSQHSQMNELEPAFGDKRWDAAACAWNRFLSQVLSTKDGLRCSYSNAWFRGHDDSCRLLLPSLLHQPDERRRDRIRQIGKEIRSLIEPFEKVRKKLSRLKAPEKRALLQREFDALQSRLRSLNARKDLLQGEVRVTGERDAFMNYSFRSPASYRSSWETLAEMRHHGIPTRLLDWTRNLSIAVFFALEQYLTALTEFWAEFADRRQTIERRHRRERCAPPQIPCPLPYYDPGIPTHPCVWILNPHRLAHRAIEDHVRRDGSEPNVEIETKIWNLALDSQLDYYDRFLVKDSWPFRLPIPTFSPWHSPRLSAQQGMFTVQGKAVDPLDQLVGNRIVDRVHLCPEAAIFGAMQLRTLFDMDKFILFRDLDTLSKEITFEYLQPERSVCAEAVSSYKFAVQMRARLKQSGDMTVYGWLREHEAEVKEGLGGYQLPKLEVWLRRLRSGRELELVLP